MKKLLLFNFLAFTVGFTWSQELTKSILVTDMLQIQRANQFEISPTKELILFNLQKIKLEEGSAMNYEYDNQLWMADVKQNYALRQLTYSKEKTGQATFSPDGKSILFVRPSNGKPQLFLMQLSGGEPLQLTDFKYGVNAPKWSPDGKKIIFSSTIKIEEMAQDSTLGLLKGLPEWSSEKPGFTDNSYLNTPISKADPNGNLTEIRAYLNQNEKEHKAKVINKLQFQGEASASGELRFNHLFIIDVAAKAKPRAITSGFNSYVDPYFTNNNEIVVNAKFDDKIFPDRLLETGIFKVNLASKQVTLLYGTKGKAFEIASVSPSGKYLIYAESEIATPNIPKLKVIDLPAGKEIYTINLDRNTDHFKWTDKEDFVYFTIQSNGGVPLYRMSLKNGQAEKLSSEEQGIDDFVIGKKSLVYAKTSVSSPCELEVADEKMKEKKIISAFNSPWLANKKLSFPEKHTFTNEEGMEIEYWVMKPSNYVEGKKYPLLLEIHGGPSAMWGPGESSMWHEYQYFCSQGYGVIYSNPRGSGGYGEKFLRANMDNWGNGPMNDVLGALDRTISQGWADTSRLLVSGGSYAGYLVSWIIGHDQRFKAACSQRGVYDLKTFFGEGNAWRLVPNYFGGYPWEEKTLKVIERESPINYVANIKTPYIIFHGENDLRTGVIQGEMLYKSLKVLGRPVEYVRHPGATHEITRSGDNRQRIDQMLRTYEFFERFIN
jgi:dipeptidyl aminopeptidase/acylaminoacyl peptidase